MTSCGLREGSRGQVSQVPPAAISAEPSGVGRPVVMTGGPSGRDMLLFRQGMASACEAFCVICWGAGTGVWGVRESQDVHAPPCGCSTLVRCFERWQSLLQNRRGDVAALTHISRALRLPYGASDIWPPSVSDGDVLARLQLDLTGCSTHPLTPILAGALIGVWCVLLSLIKQAVQCRLVECCVRPGALCSSDSKHLHDPPVDCGKCQAATMPAQHS